MNRNERKKFDEAYIMWAGLGIVFLLLMFIK